MTGVAERLTETIYSVPWFMYIKLEDTVEDSVVIDMATCSYVTLYVLSAHNCKTHHVHYCTYIHNYILCEVLTCTLSIE